MLLLPIIDSLRPSLDIEGLHLALVLAGDVLRDIVGLDRRSGDALLAAIQWLGSFALIGWTTRRLLERWLIGDSMYEPERTPKESPRWRCLLGFWRRVE